MRQAGLLLVASALFVLSGASPDASSTSHLADAASDVDVPIPARVVYESAYGHVPAPPSPEWGEDGTDLAATHVASARDRGDEPTWAVPRFAIDQAEHDRLIDLYGLHADQVKPVDFAREIAMFALRVSDCDWVEFDELLDRGRRTTFVYEIFPGGNCAGDTTGVVISDAVTVLAVARTGWLSTSHTVELGQHLRGGTRLIVEARHPTDPRLKTLAQIQPTSYRNLIVLAGVLVLGCVLLVVARSAIRHRAARRPEVPHGAGDDA